MDHISISTPANALSRISWASVLAGVVIAAAMMFCLNELVMAFGMSLLKPRDASHDASIPPIAIAGAVAWIASALVSVFVGGWAAAHLARQPHDADSVLHGLMVWALGLLFMGFLAATAAGAVVGGAFSLVSNGIGAAGSAVGGMAHGAGAALANGSALPRVPGMPTFNWDSIKFQAESLLKEHANAPTTAGNRKPDGGSGPGTGEAQNHQQSNAAGSDASAAARDNGSAVAGNPPASEPNTSAGEGMALLGRLFSVPNAPLSDTDRATATTMLSSFAGMNKDAAAKQIGTWEQTAQEASKRYDALRDEAEKKARATADAAAKALADAAWIAFVATVLGASAAMLGAYIGGCALKRAPPELPLKDSSVAHA